MKLASDIREQEISKTRRAFRLREFRGVRLEEVAELEAIGIVTVDQMLAAGRTRDARRQLAEQTGISPPSILELVKLSDLSRLGAIKSVRDRLYYEAGLDTPDKFVPWEPEALRQMLVEFVERTGFDGIARLPLGEAVGRLSQQLQLAFPIGEQRAKVGAVELYDDSSGPGSALGDLLTWMVDPPSEPEAPRIKPKSYHAPLLCVS